MKPGLLMLPSAVSDSRVHNILPNKIETDFQFSRASAATRVNHQGLIEEVGYFGPELVQNGNFSELGSELITDGDFSSDANWSLNDWFINNGKATLPVTSTNNLNQSISITQNKTYKIVFTISNLSDGGIRIRLGTGSMSSTITTNGTHTLYLQHTTTNHVFRIYANTSGVFNGEIDNVSVKQVDPNDRWTKGAGWGYGDGVATITSSTTDSIFQDALTLGKTYMVKFEITEISSGSLRIGIGINFSSYFTTTGIYTYIGNPTTDGLLRINPTSGTTAKIDNVSAVEVQGDRPRLDYDPTNPTCPHLLLEPQSTNLVTFSEDFSQWAKQGGGTGSVPVLTSGYTSPDGTNNAYKVSFNKGTGTTTSDFSILSSNAWSVQSNTASFYIKADSPQKIVFRNSTNWILVNVTTEWQRVSKTDTGNSLQLGLRDGYGISGVPNTSEVYIFGAQAEATTYATSYIPTAGATETRVAETCNNAGNVDTFNSTEGVLYAEIKALANDGTNRQISISNGTVTERVYFGFRANTNEFILSSKDSSYVIATVNDATDYNKYAFQYKSGNFKAFVNGVSYSLTADGGSLPTSLDRLNFDDGAGNSDFYGKVKGLATYNRALTDTELYTITSTQYSAYSGMVAALGNYTIPC